MAKQTTFPQWKGFESRPEGCLLEQVIDLNGEVGFAYERSCEYYKDFHTHDRLMLIFPRGSSSMEVRTKSPKKTLSVDSSTVLFIPGGLEHDDEGTASIYDTMALYPTPKAIQSAAKKLGLPISTVDEININPLKIRRSSRLETYIQDYFFERVILRRDGADEDAAHLARRILEEAFCIIYPKRKLESIRPELGLESISEKALKVIESNLFEDLDLAKIAKRSGASVSTLLRNFKADLKTTPFAYIKNRRLEEAYKLLMSGERSVSEVAVLVGYENLGAFSEAYKSKYGSPPSHIRKSR